MRYSKHSTVICSLLVIVFCCAALPVFGHGTSHELEIPAGFEPGPPIPGLQEVAEFLLGEGRSLFNSVQVEQLEIIGRLFEDSAESEERAEIDRKRADTERLRAYGEHLLLELIREISGTIQVDVGNALAEIEPDGFVRLSGDSGVVVLHVKDGDATTRLQLKEANIERMNSEEVPPEPIFHVSGGETWVFVAVQNAPVGRTQFPVAFVETDADAVDSVKEPFALEEEDIDFGWAFDKRLKVAMITVEAPPTGFLKVTVLDDNGEPTPAMVRLTSETDGRLKRPSNAIDFSPHFGAIRTGSGSAPEPINVPGAVGGPYWCVPGPFHMVVPAGKWEIRVYRGFEREPVVDTVRVDEGETAERTYQPERWVDMPTHGWYSGDDHIHARIMSDHDARRLMAWLKAVDIHVGNTLEMGDRYRTHYEQRGFGPDFRVQDGDHVLVPGQEDPRYWRGHAIGLNLKDIVRDEEHYVLNDLTVDRIRAQGGLYGFAHVNHNMFNVQRDMTLLLPRGKADFGEILQFSWLNTDLYYKFLDLGYRLTASAGSDTPYGTGIGELSVYACIGDQPFTADAWFEAMRRGRTFVTNGPMVDFQIDGAHPGDTVQIEPGKKVRVKVRAWGRKGGSAPELVQVYKHSEVIYEAKAADDATESISFEFELQPGYGAWVAVRVFGRDESQAHTTPIYLVRDGFRFWNVGRAVELIRERYSTIDEMDAELGKLEEQARQGVDREATLLWPDVVKNADALRERFDLVRGLFRKLEQTLETELPKRAAITLADNPVSGQDAISARDELHYTKDTYTYKTVDEHEIPVDVYRYPGDDVRPALIWIHGGALIFGTRNWLPSAQLEKYLQAGYTVISIDYRLAPETKLAAIVEDITDAYAWVRANGPDLFKIDPDRIAVVGHSAGGYLTLMAGLRLRPRPKALVSFYGYGDITGPWYSRPDPFYSQMPAVSKDRLPQLSAIRRYQVHPRNSHRKDGFNSTFTVGSRDFGQEP